MVTSREFERALRGWLDVSMHRSFQAFTQWMNDSGLSRSQIGALMRLHYGGHCTISSIGDELGITTAAASQLVDRLFQQGLLEREEDPEDRRTKRIALSETGMELVKKSHEARLGWMGELNGVQTDTERQEAIRVLLRLTKTAHELAGPELNAYQEGEVA
jgi:DNA-binding MarR family transcriptional regulator